MQVSLWRRTFHDMSKLYPSEWFPYVEHFHGSMKGTTPQEDPNFFAASVLHCNIRNDHHWQYWSGKEMPVHAVVEMVTDWIAMSEARDGNALQWFKENVHTTNLHNDSQLLAVGCLIWYYNNIEKEVTP